jgi:hypothetical protein
MTDVDMSLLQRWLGERFAEVGQRLLALERAVNEFAKVQATSGEVDAVVARLTTVEQRLSQLELHNPH